MLSFSLLCERYQGYEIIDPLTGQELDRIIKTKDDPNVYVSPYSIKGIFRSIGSFIKNPSSKEYDTINKRPDSLDNNDGRQDSSIDVPSDDTYSSFIA